MNERIEQLAEQAGVFAGDFAGAGLYSIHNKEEVEKFAELIVLECAKACEENSWMALNGFQRSKQIKEHFGVDTPTE